MVAISSEIGWLEQVILHSPGPEVASMSPQSAHDALFDDIIHAPHAAQEHAQLAAALAQFGTVLQLVQLLTETLEIAAARASLLGRLCLLYNAPYLYKELIEQPSAEIAQKLISGMRHPATTLAAMLEPTGYALPPLYNAYFMRDAAMCVGERVIISAMRSKSRWGESLISRAIFAYHPTLQSQGFWLDGSQPPSPLVVVEGGDVHVLREDLVLIGCGERTSIAGIEILAQQFAQNGIKHVIVQPIPPKRAYIHFDMVFTMLDKELCAIHAPVITGPEAREAILYTFQKGQPPHLTRHAALLPLLAELGMPLEVVLTGGHDPLQQAREQWQKGTNFFAMAPGKVIGYARNEATYLELEQHGFRVVTGADVAAGKVDLTAPGRVAVAMGGAELSRGGGGCRCMTLPIRRRSL